MRFTYAEAMTDARLYAPLARAAEAAGYTSMTVADSLIYPKESDSSYPYTDTGDREFLEDKEFIETMVLCAHLFAVTSTLRLTPFVLKLPVRPPVLVAKQASSLAFLSDNRLGLGVGLSPRPEDFVTLGVPWERRGKRMDECMDVLRGLTSGDFFGYDGEFYKFPALKQTPAPSAPIPLPGRRAQRRGAAPRRTQGRRLDARRRRRG
ncbi:LLM class flavin-dependent oxidoreductase [Nocardioides sp. B-3]|uniref:LLM class flavin-dependent oxidoreductase n=1 Tax=Nocardioides sp. B-3 TaxID=2895565 RepID=UPI00215325D0|nr:LLM class flavin-dependent oxidoreductase [Nocardioides sp. B-3]UUZ61423.1 LLM class flavin-dependent oxidoreductase [Nocardioides sp. B-3]